MRNLTYPQAFVSDIAVFVLKRDIKLQPINQPTVIKFSATAVSYRPSPCTILFFLENEIPIVYKAFLNDNNIPVQTMRLLIIFFSLWHCLTYLIRAVNPSSITTRMTVWLSAFCTKFVIMFIRHLVIAIQIPYKQITDELPVLCLDNDRWWCWPIPRNVKYSSRISDRLRTAHTYAFWIM